MTKLKTIKEKEKELKDELKEIHLQINELSEFIRILMLGHPTEKGHKNIFKLMHKKLCKFSENRKKLNKEKEKK